jgi:hypothetical protein
MQALVRELLLDGAAGIWALDDAAILDLTTNGRDGNVTGTSVVTPGPFGSHAARNFPAGAHRVTVADANDWSSAEHTIGCMFRMASLPSQATYLLSKNTGSGSAAQEWNAFVNTDGSLGHIIKRSNQTTYARSDYEGSAHIDNRWHLFAATYGAASNYPYIYLDGVQRTRVTSGSLASRAGNTSALLSIGNNGAGTGGNVALEGDIAYPFYVASQVTADRVAAYWDAVVRGLVSY